LETEIKEPIVETVYYDYDILVNGKSVPVRGIDRKMVFVDIFEYTDFDISRPQGILELTLNGIKANYTDLLKSGDVITLGWRQMKG
jgi:hypothetical protein